MLVGSVIQDQLTRGSNWPFAAALAVVLMVLTSLMIVVYRKVTHVKDLEGLFWKKKWKMVEPVSGYTIACYVSAPGYGGDFFL